MCRVHAKQSTKLLRENFEVPRVIYNCSRIGNRVARSRTQIPILIRKCRNSVGRIPRAEIEIHFEVFDFFRIGGDGERMRSVERRGRNETGFLEKDVFQIWNGWGGGSMWVIIEYLWNKRNKKKKRIKEWK